jgi:hypothetical protein
VFDGVFFSALFSSILTKAFPSNYSALAILYFNIYLSFNFSKFFLLLFIKAAL